MGFKIKASFLSLIAITAQPIYADNGALFQVQSFGAPANVKMTLCLDALGPISCQKFTASGLDLLISPTVQNHVYPNAGIKIEAPYLISNINVNCTNIINDYCIFAFSSSAPKSFSLIDPSNPEPILLVGNYHTSGGSNAPYLAQTKDGVNWNYPQSIITNVPGGQSITLNAASCEGNTCVTVGASSQPFLASSIDGGDSWTYDIGTTETWPTSLVRGSFIDTACNGILCIAGGYYTTSSSPFPQPSHYPLLTSSLTAGVWNYQVTDAGPFPNNYESSSSTEFVSTTCSGTTCLALGQYQSESDGLIYPMILTLANNGTSTYSLQAGSSALPNDFAGLGGSSGQIACSDNVCLVALGYQSTNGTGYPLVLTSINSGQTWSLAIDSSSSLPGDFSNQGEFQTATCNGNVCAAGGSYNGSPAWVAVSTNVTAGSPWNFTVYSNQPTNPTDYVSNGYINAMSCQGSFCLAAGDYLNYYPTGDIYMAQILSSANNGSTWSYSLDAEGPLPTIIDTSDPGADFYRLFTLNCYDNPNICLAAGIYTATDGGVYPAAAVSRDGGQTWSYTIEAGASLPLDYGAGVEINNLSD